MKKFHHYVRKDGHIEMEIYACEKHDIRVRYPMFDSLRRYTNVCTVKYDNLDQVTLFLLSIDRRECLGFMLQWYAHDETLSSEGRDMVFNTLLENAIFHDIYYETYEKEFGND